MLTLTDQMQDLGRVFVSWDDDGGAIPHFYSWRVYRQRAGVSKLIFETTNPATTSFSDYLASENVNQAWTLRQVTVAYPGAPQVEFDRYTVEMSPWSDSYWLVHPTDEAFNVKLLHVTSHSHNDNYEQATIPLIDRGYHVEQGTNFGETGSLSTHFTDRPEGTARQQRQKVELLKASYSEVWLRTPFGDMILVALGQLGFDREAGVGLSENGTMTIPYTEVS